MRYYERAEANGGPDAKSVLRYPGGLLAIELLDVSRMWSLYVQVSHVNAEATGVLRTLILSRPSPHESDDGLVPSAEDSTTFGPSEQTSPRRKDRTKQRPNDGTGRNDETPESERSPTEPEPRRPNELAPTKQRWKIREPQDVLRSQRRNVRHDSALGRRRNEQTSRTSQREEA